ncbi:hypothetical protein EBU94_01045 [bacterium]|nr:hypothetical protein [bacterium]
MIEHILIPTLGRINKQVTYNSLSEKWKAITKFVVQAHEYDQMVEIYGVDKIICLPPEIKKLSPTREWMLHKFKHTRHFVFDDDLSFRVKEPYTGTEDPERKWQSRTFTEQDFDDAFNLVEEWMNEGIVFGGFMPSIVIADIAKWPTRENYRVMSNIFLDGPNLPKDINYNRVQAAQDLDVTLQLLTRGYRNRVSTKYMVYCSETNAPGGCSIYRTLDVLNENQYKLAELWPDFVTTKIKHITNGPFKGQDKVVLTIQTKKAFEYGTTNQKINTNNFKLF